MDTVKKNVYNQTECESSKDAYFGFGEINTEISEEAFESLKSRKRTGEISPKALRYLQNALKQNN